MFTFQIDFGNEASSPGSGLAPVQGWTFLKIPAAHHQMLHPGNMEIKIDEE
jgi:hypothetical protein